MIGPPQQSNAAARLDLKIFVAIGCVVEPPIRCRHKKKPQASCALGVPESKPPSTTGSDRLRGLGVSGVGPRPASRPFLCGRPTPAALGSCWRHQGHLVALVRSLNRRSRASGGNGPAWAGGLRRQGRRPCGTAAPSPISKRPEPTAKQSLSVLLRKRDGKLAESRLELGRGNWRHLCNTRRENVFGH